MRNLEINEVAQVAGGAAGLFSLIVQDGAIGAAAGYITALVENLSANPKVNYINGSAIGFGIGALYAIATYGALELDLSFAASRTRDVRPLPAGLNQANFA